MATPSKVSLKKKKCRKLFTPTVLATQSGQDEDVEFEKENSDRVGSLGTFRSRKKSDRRNSTILAGNLTILNQENDPDLALSPNVSLRRKKIPSPRQIEPADPNPAVDLLTEDESSFYSCDESQSLNRNVQPKDPWMTELTEDDEDDTADPKLRTPVNQPHGKSHVCLFTVELSYQTICLGNSAVRPATFFSVGKRKSLFKINPRRVLAAGSDSSDEEEETKNAGDRPPHQATFVAASDEEDEDEDVPLVDLGRKYLSDSKFGTVASWVNVSPFGKKPRDVSQRSQSGQSDDEEIGSLPKSDPEDGDLRPRWAAPPPVSQNKFNQQSSRSSKAPLSTSGSKTSTYVGDRSSKAFLTTSSSKTSTFVGDRSSKALLSTKDTSSCKTSTSTYIGDRSSKAPLSTSGSKTSTYVGDRSSKALLSTKDTSSSKTSTDVGDRSSKAPLSVSETLTTRTLDDKEDLRSSKGEGRSGGSNINQKSSNDFSDRPGTEENDSSQGEMRKSLENNSVYRGPSYSSQVDRISSRGILSEEKQLEELEETLEKINNLDIQQRHPIAGEDPSSNSEIQSSLLLGTKPKPKPRVLPIENSVNAVRCWTEETEQSTSHKDKHERHSSDGTSDSDDFEQFLTNIKSKKKEPKKADSSGEDFVVPDDQSDSDESPQLSLYDRILKKSVVAKTKSGPVGGKYSRVISEEEDELPDIESPVTVSKKKPNIKKQNDVLVISSDEDSGRSDKAFDNLYEPKNYQRIPSPAPVVTPKIKKPVRKKAAEEKFKTPEPSKTLTFLSSLTKDTPLARCHPEAVPYVKQFKTSKAELAVRLYSLYNTEIFENALPDDMEITWNVRLTKTAGLCYSKRHRKYNIETRSSRIELSTKVIDSGDRLRDTLIHEMCHAASWIISGYRDGHGPLWRTWAEKAMRRFPELPVIDRCHSYQINTKYTYR